MFFDEIIIPEAVHQEIKRAPFPIAENAEQLINEKYITVKDYEIFSNIHTIYDEIRAEYQFNKRRRLGDGEAEAMAFVASQGGILASNNLSDVGYFVDKYSMSLVTSPYLIAAGVEKQYISFDEGELIWKKMVDNRLRLPGKFENYYQKRYKKDKKKYGKRLNLK